MNTPIISIHLEYGNRVTVILCDGEVRRYRLNHVQSLWVARLVCLWVASNIGKYSLYTLKPNGERGLGLAWMR